MADKKVEDKPKIDDKPKRGRKPKSVELTTMYHQHGSVVQVKPDKINAHLAAGWRFNK